MKLPVTVMLGISLVFGCVALGAAQQEKPPEHSTSTSRRDKPVDVTGLDLPDLGKKERGCGAHGSSNRRTDLSLQQRKACDKLSRAAERGRTEEVRRLLARGVPADTCGTLALLMFSPGKQIGPAQVESAKVLLAAGADPRVWTPLGPHGVIFTPLTLTWRYDGPDKEKVTGELIEAMLAAERRLGWKEEYCYPGQEVIPLLSIAAFFASDVSQVEMLLAKGADVNQKGCRGGTALMAAAWMGNSEIVKALIVAGADINAQADDGATALSIATKRNRTEVADLLRQAGAKQ